MGPGWMKMISCGRDLGVGRWMFLGGKEHVIVEGEKRFCIVLLSGGARYYPKVTVQRYRRINFV